MPGPAAACRRTVYPMHRINERDSVPYIQDEII